MTLFRKILFWSHLVAGIVAGLVIAIMSFTGAAIAFEKELVAWSENDARRVVPPGETTARLPLNELLQRVRDVQPEGRPSAITISADPASAVVVAYGRDDAYYANPYTGAVAKPGSTHMHDFMHAMTDWHRWLGREGSSRPAGKAINGASNAAFLFLAVSGLYLWWPRNWSWRGVRAIAIFNVRLAGKARDFNWHNAVGLWTAPVLIVLTLTAMPISYRWASNLVYRITGSEPPAQTAGPGSMVSAVVVPTPEAGAKPLGHDVLLASVQREIPRWTEITFRLAAARGGAPRTQNSATATSSGEPRARRAETGESPRGPQAVNVTVRTDGQWPLFSSTALALDPFTGVVLRKDVFADQNAGRRLRSWTRFLHTGEALGWPGKLVAGLSSLVALVLVWTGFALAWRRFFPRPGSIA